VVNLWGTWFAAMSGFLVPGFQFPAPGNGLKGWVGVVLANAAADCVLVTRWFATVLPSSRFLVSGRLGLWTAVEGVGNQQRRIVLPGTLVRGEPTSLSSLGSRLRTA
jgi:hypothetical protein